MRFFDVTEANRLVPTLQQTFDAVRPKAEGAQALARRLHMLEQMEPSGKDVAKLRNDLNQLLEQIRAEIAKLEEIGVEIKGLDGLADFRAMLKGRHVYLCWKSGEDKVTHWHELDTGFAGRKRIETESEFARTYLS